MGFLDEIKLNETVINSIFDTLRSINKKIISVESKILKLASQYKINKKKFKNSQIPIKVYQQCQKKQNEQLSNYYRKVKIDCEIFNLLAAPAIDPSLPAAST